MAVPNFTPDPNALDIGYSDWLNSYGLTPSTENLSMFQKSQLEPQSFLGLDKTGWQGVGTVAGLAGTGWGIYNDMKANDRAEEAFKLQKDAYDYNKQRAQKFHTGLAKSGLTQ